MGRLNECLVLFYVERGCQGRDACGLVAWRRFLNIITGRYRVSKLVWTERTCAIVQSRSEFVIREMTDGYNPSGKFRENYYFVLGIQLHACVLSTHTTYRGKAVLPSLLRWQCLFILAFGCCSGRYEWGVSCYRRRNRRAVMIGSNEPRKFCE